MRLRSASAWLQAWWRTPRRKPDKPRRRARHDVAGGAAHRRAVEVEADAGDEVLDVAFGEAGVGAGRAGLDAAEARVDAAAHRLGMSGLLRVRAEHGADSNGGHGVASSCLPRSTPPTPGIGYG